MKVYRALWNVQDSLGAMAQPGGEVVLDAASAAALAKIGAIHPDPIGDAPAAVVEALLAPPASGGPSEIAVKPELGADTTTPIEELRRDAILALVPRLQVGDFTQAGQLRAEARRRIAAELGFEPTDDEIRAAGEAYAKANADQGA